MKVKKSEIQLLIAVLGVLLVVVTYFLVYAKFNELSDAMESQNMSLRSQVSTLEVLEQRKADYLAATEKMKTYITGFENRFPADILPEDSIMMVKNMEDATRTYVANISFGTIGEVAYDAQASADNSALAAATADAPADTAAAEADAAARAQIRPRLPHPLSPQREPPMRRLICMRCLWASVSNVPMMISRGWFDIFTISRSVRASRA